MFAVPRAALLLTCFVLTCPPTRAQPPDPDLQAADEAFQEGSYEEAEVRYRGIIRQHPDNHGLEFRYAYCLHANQKFAEAVEMFRQAASDEQFRPAALYNVACGLALLGKNDEACEALDAAIDGGFNDLRLMQNDTDLKSVQSDPRFAMALARLEASSPRQALSWDRLAARFKSEERAGFSGAVLVVRDGQVVLHEGYGMADRSANIRNTAETIFAIGSTPIDFTKAGILLLGERGKLDLDDPIGKYFENVPEDKRSITLKHLMTGRSGLRDFHDAPGDADPDLTWIDRDEAVRRILAQELLFEPGRGQAHSHSAWGLLAAVIEKASGQSYPDFTREHLFEPAGMEDTGFNGTPYDRQRMAVGAGAKSHGEINAPPYWGPTSWLVMGSGGQVSTVGDINRWLEALRAGKILSAESLARYFGPGEEVLAGGNPYGYEIVYSTGARNRFVLISNDNHPRRAAANRHVADALASLVQGAAGLPPFTLGVTLDIGPDGRATITEVVEDGPAAAAGLQPGDVLLAIDGEPLGSNPQARVRSHLARGGALRVKVERDGKEMQVDLAPVRRS